MYDNFFKTTIALVLFTSGLLGFVHESRSQSQQDSLLNELRTAQGKARYDVLYELVRINFNVNNEVALAYASQAYEVARSIGDSLGIVKSARARGQVLMKFNDLNGAARQFEEVVEVARRNGFSDQLKFVLNGLALAYTHLANYDKALECHFQSLVIRENEGNKSEISITQHNIGLVYYKLRDFPKALEYFLQALGTKREANDLYDLDRTLVNIGLCYNALGQYKLALDYLNESVKFCEAGCSSEVKTEMYYSLGRAHLGLHEVKAAREHFMESYQIAKENLDKRYEAENLVFLHRVSLEEGDTRSAFQYLHQAESLLDSIEFNELKLEIYGAFAEAYSREQDYQQAAHYQRQYIDLKDSVYSEKLISNLATIQTNYEERQNMAIIASKNEALVRQQLLLVAIVIIAVMTGLLVFVLYRSNLVKKRVNQALSDAKAIIEDQNRQLTSLNRNLEKMVDARTMELQIANEALKRVNDELDNFIYKTSHDIRGPLASLKGMCNVAIMDVKDPLALDYFTKLDATAEKLNTILTRLLIINQINNSSASHELIDFREIVDDVIVLERKRGLPPKLIIRKEIDPGIVFYSDKELIRIILENLIDNAIKFYNDSERIEPFVQIKVEKDGAWLKVRVIDNGIGISQVNPDKIFQMFSRASERSGTGGIGLYLTKTATEKIGGQINLKTTAEGYTEFYVKFTLTTSRVRAEIAV